jgi:hypothetical protein
MATNKEQIVSTWRGLGWTDNQIAAGLGNLYQESTFNPLALNASEGAFGIAQWRLDRLTNLQNYAASNGLNYQDVSTQAAFVNYEMRVSGETSAGAAFFGATDQSPGNLARIFDARYERSAGTEREQRASNAEQFASGDNLNNPNFKPGVTQASGQNISGRGTPGGAAGAGGSGGGAACASAGLTAIAGMAMGGLLGGLGLGLNGPFAQLTNALNQIPGVSAVTSAFQQATSVLNAAGGAINSLTGGAFQALSSMGANILPGLSNVIPGVLQGAIGTALGPITSVLQNPLSLPNVVQQFTAAGGLGGFLSTIGNNMVGNFVGGTIANLTNNLQMGGALGEITRNITGGISEAMGQTFGNVTGGVGEMFRNMDGMLTYGLSTLGNNLGAVAQNMIATGQWDTSDLSRLMSPGAIAGQILSRGLGEVTGLTSQLINNNIPVAGLNSAIYDGQISKILSGINSTGALDAVKSTFAVTTNISNLGDLADINKMMPDVAKTLPVKSFEGLGQELVKLQITEAKSLTELGSTLLKVENGRDLNHISQLDTPIHKPTGDLILKTFGYGSGTYGELTASDFMGTPAGIVHNDTLPVIIKNMEYIQDHPELTCYYELVQLLNEVLNGQHRVTTTTGGGGGGGGA